MRLAVRFYEGEDMEANQRQVTMKWTGGLAFEGKGTSASEVTIDGDSRDGPSPMETLLLAGGGCSGTDVVSILEKMRVDLEECLVTVTGTRREEDPRRYVALHFRFTLRGEGLDESKSRRAIELSLEKYCSVIHSLAPDIDVSYDLDLE